MYNLGFKKIRVNYLIYEDKNFQVLLLPDAIALPNSDDDFSMEAELVRLI